MDNIEDLIVEYTNQPIKAKGYEGNNDFIVRRDSTIPNNGVDSPYDVMWNLPKLAVDLRYPCATVYDKMSYLMWMVKYDSYDDVLPVVIGECDLTEYEYELLDDPNGFNRFGV